jgi:hypothetical protein
MAAARKKGKWMGGIPVLGYDAPGGGKLVVNNEEAELVRAIFAWYIECESVDELLSRAQEQGLMNKSWRVREGRGNSARPFARTSMERLLSNVVYIGQVQHAGKTYSGEQPSIVEEWVWRRAQNLLEQDRVRRLVRNRTRVSPLTASCRTVEPNGPAERIPRIAKLMALALKFEGMIRQAAVKDYAVLGGLGQVSRARVTQIMNLLNLAPDIQEQILFLRWEAAQHHGICEQSIRPLTSLLRWNAQRAEWNAMRSRYLAREAAASGIHFGLKPNS